MTFPQVYQIFEYWRSFPPEHEILAMLASVYTTWKPNAEKLTPQEAHRRSLEERWKSGAMSVKQMFESQGGVISFDSRAGGPQLTGDDLPGIGPFPGVLH